MIEKTDISLLEKYLAGELGADQLVDEQGQPLTQAQIDQAIGEYNELLVQLEGAALKADLQKKYSPEVAIERPSRRLYWLATAAGILLLATFAFLWQRANTGAEFEDYFIPFAQLETFRGEESSAYSEALETYSRRDYASAFTLFGELNNPGKVALFFKGVSAMAIGEWQAAIESLSAAGVDQSNRYYQQTRWYLALAYWQSGDIEKAKEYLRSIVVGEDNYDQAQELLGLL